jgi:hypothetical protein
MSHGNSVSVDAAISKACSSKRNTYVLKGQIDRSSIVRVVNCIRQISCRVRLCFTDALILGEAADALSEFFWEKADVDTLIFINTNIQRSQSFMASLTRLNSLSTLSFSGCHLTDSDVDYLVTSFDGLPHLRSLDLSEDRLGPSVFSGVCRALQRLPELAAFRWAGNQLGDPAAFVALMNKGALRTIDFSGTPLGTDWIRVLGDLLDRDWQIAELKVTDCSTIIAEKIHRNRERFRNERAGPAFRMSRYAAPLGDDLFEDEPIQ